MTMKSDVQSMKNGEIDAKTAALDGGSGEPVLEERKTDDESEDEDVDFNPFFKESLSEASSSLSSEAEGFDTDVFNSHCGNAVGLDDCGPLPADIDEGGFGDDCNKGSVLCSEQEDGKVQDRENGSSSGIDAVEDVVEVEVKVGSFHDEDAICKRTRARYSLASFTLDELETFLQESDDDDDVQNVDEEEEYKKFLAAVLGGGNGDDQGDVEGNDDDEDNDADFELEIEEALESDIDDCIETFCTKDKLEKGSRRPETRQKGRQKANGRTKHKDSQQGKMSLRPLVPLVPASSVPCLGPRYSAIETISSFPSYGQHRLSTGFQAHQIGQLYCLIYEHVQLLVQVYSLCVLDPSRQHIAAQIKGLLSELLHKRDLVLAWRKGPYPNSCFLPSNTCPSVSGENEKIVPTEDSGASTSDCEGSQWLPAVGGSVVSVLDVVPLKLVGKYIDGISKAVREHQRQCLETTNLYLEKQPLFPHPICSALEGDCNYSKGNASSPNSHEVSPNYKAPKKTLAATLVESTKKQSVALVSPEITKLAQPFYSLFNPALFPHKPPSSAAANRVLFTDAEDVLLAMGMVEYNNDWKAIRHRFLPCKSEHQIFVRAKNRCSSKAPENPIKTVRKMKTSPLTEEEKFRIQEGLKTFKLDWTLVWRFVVPYRDPNLLPRQWRIAIGTQKSYKGDSAKRERRRINESKRRSKMRAMDETLTGSGENASGEYCMDNDNEAYVHEAFLADWISTSSGPDTSKVSVLHQRDYVPGAWPFASSPVVLNGADNHESQGSKSDKGHAHELSGTLEDSLHIRQKSLHPYMTDSYPPPTSSSKTFGESQHHSQNAGKRIICNLVKLAPELPPVKLPSAVRVISQSSLKTFQLGSSSGPQLEKTCPDSTGIDCSASLVKPTQDKNKISNSNPASFFSQKDGLMKNRCLTRERGTEIDPQMHPLLFRTIEGHLPCYSVNNSIRIPTFSFFPAVQHQMNATLVRNSCAADQSFSSKEIAVDFSSLDFHPLLKRAKGFSGSSSDPGLNSSFLSTNLELSRDQYVEGIVYNAGASAAEIAAATKPTSPTADANDLDLDIHLSSSSKRRKVSSHEVAETNLTLPSVNGARVVETVNGRSGKHCELSSLAEPQSADLNAGSHVEISVPDNSSALSQKLDGNNSICVNANVGDQPPLEIVMEQEELSDSDEEELGNVEFEREEMADSDGEEESGSEQVDNIHNNVEKSDTGLGTGGPGQLFKSLVFEASERTRALKNERKPRLGSAGPGKAHTKSSWLSLNSHGSHYKSLTRTRRAKGSEGGPVPSNPKRQSKKDTSGSKDVSSGELNRDISQQDPSSNASRKSRKHSKSSSPLRIDVLSGISSPTKYD